MENEPTQKPTHAHEESLIEKARDLLNNAVGLPSGKFPDGESKSPKTDNSPTGTLTSDDAEGLAPHSGTGIQPVD
jgi:hypothetical protein